MLPRPVSEWRDLAFAPQFHSFAQNISVALGCPRNAGLSHGGHCLSWIRNPARGLRLIFAPGFLPPRPAATQIKRTFSWETINSCVRSSGRQAGRLRLHYPGKWGEAAGKLPDRLFRGEAPAHFATQARRNQNSRACTQRQLRRSRWDIASRRAEFTACAQRHPERGHPFDLELPGARPSPPFPHSSSFFGSERTAAFRTPAGIADVGPGDIVLTPPGEAHQTNTGSDEVRYLLGRRSDHAVDYFHSPDSNKWDCGSGFTPRNSVLIAAIPTIRSRREAAPTADPASPARALGLRLHAQQHVVRGNVERAAVVAPTAVRRGHASRECTEMFARRKKSPARRPDPSPRDCRRDRS
jgi:hypothetical protein